MRRIDWVVYAKKPFGGPAQVLAYLGRYTHRVAIANSRLVALDESHVAFTWRDYRSGGATKVMRLKVEEFIRRFLLHVLPDGFHRIRSFGFMANGHRTANLALCRSIIEDRDIGMDGQATPPPASGTAGRTTAVPVCPHCAGVMRIVGGLPHSFHRPGPRAPPFKSAAP
jgi:Putative transposase